MEGSKAFRINVKKGHLIKFASSLLRLAIILLQESQAKQLITE